MIVSMKNRWKTSKTAVLNISYHLIWCPKYRRKVLVEDTEERLKELLLEKAKDIGVAIEELQVMPEHLHLFVKSPPTNSPHYIVQQFKGYTSRILRQEFKSLRSRLPTLWTRSYYCESIGHISKSTIKQYIDNQKSQ